MTRFYPAIEIQWPGPAADSDRELLLAVLDEHAPTAVEETADGLRVFFVTREARDDAAAATTAASPGVRCTAIEVSDENWAERSQASLEPVSAGRVVVLPREELRSTRLLNG